MGDPGSGSLRIGSSAPVNGVVRPAGDMNPSVLLVVYSFPPARTAGSVRTWNIAKYLSRSGWKVTVLTPDPFLLRNVEEPDAAELMLQHEGIRRLATGHRWRFLAADYVKWPNTGVSWLAGGVLRRIARYVSIPQSAGWVKPAFRACAQLKPNDVDLVFASGPSFSAFSIGRHLADRLGCPYALDYRDLWSRHLHNPSPAAAREEAAIIAGSAAVTVVSPSWGRILDQQFGAAGKLHVVSNGYDPEHLGRVEPHDFGHFAIVYAGSFWPPRRVITPLMAALCQLERTPSPRNDWMLHYYGKHQRHVLAEAQRFAVTHRVVTHGEVPRAAALTAVKGAGVAVVITSVERNAAAEDNGMVTGKIFETVGLRTPTLVVAPSGSDANVVAETTGLARSFTADDVDGMVDFLRQLMAGNLPQPKDPAAYAWENLVRGLDPVLRRVLAPR